MEVAAAKETELGHKPKRKKVKGGNQAKRPRARTGREPIADVERP